MRYNARMKRILLSAVLLLASTAAWPASERPSPDRRILISVEAQTLVLYEIGRPIRVYPVSTSDRGTGSRAGSERTPLGRHAIAQKIGAGLPLGAVLENRVPTGRVVLPTQDKKPSGEDLVTSRILWLEGLERGRNRGGDVDTRRRFIYIHGTPEEGRIGRPASHGCIRMKNQDVIELFDLVEVGTPVRIDR